MRSVVTKELIADLEEMSSKAGHVLRTAVSATQLCVQNRVAADQTKIAPNFTLEF